jgi:uncharacterized protein YprB with RNaseH-like and TPR domain
LKAPVRSLSKEQLVWLGTNKCKHGHTFLEHYACYMNEEMHNDERVGFLDIESSGLKANFAIMLSYCIKVRGEDKIYCDWFNEKDLKNGQDRRIVKNCIRDLGNFDRVIGHYSKRFDIPFLRTRALMLGIDFPQFGELYHTDVWDIAKRKLCLSSNRQGVIAEAINEDFSKTRISHNYWLPALQGDKKALEYIVDHNKRDVVQLEKNYEKLRVFSKITKSSI